MKKKLLLLMMATAMAVGASAELIEAKSQKQSKCKKNPQSEVIAKVSLSYEGEDLKMELVDFRTNCGAILGVSAEETEPGVLHFIIEDTTMQFASCLCPFDVTGVFEGIAPGSYDVYVDFIKTRSPGIVKNLMYSHVEIGEGRTAQLEQPSGINEMEALSGVVRLTSDNLLTLGFDGSGEVEVYDAGGRLELRIPVIGPSEILLDPLESGVHLIRVSHDGITDTLRFVK